MRCNTCRSEAVAGPSHFTWLQRVAALLLLSPFQCETCRHRAVPFPVGAGDCSVTVDRRQHKRIPVRLSLSFSAGKVKAKGLVTNISMGGCTIETDSILEEGRICYLQLYLEDGAPPVEIAGVVRSTGAKRVGVKFLRVGRESKRLFEFLHRQGA
jgi:hypothetical protein